MFNRLTKATYGFFARLRLALAAFEYGHSGAVFFAVVYDSYEGLDRSKDDPREEYYELFETPEEAAFMFRDAYPIERNMADNPRLVMVFGGIDRYRSAPNG
ncbi:hypothetical protein FHV99_004620 [Ochrobactrum sp. P20RRXII]|nr:hypothetical protein [Ochrobactrum sp. P20RRXII]NIH77368.1 hypothetical protein [Ochrobactrum sp. P20RRXII]